VKYLKRFVPEIQLNVLGGVARKDVLELGCGAAP
jgi:hypothetical protein